MVFESELLSLLLAGVSLAGGVVAGALVVLVTRRPGGRGRVEPGRVALAACAGVLVAACTYAINCAANVRPQASTPSAQDGPYGPSWMGSTLPEGTKAPDFTLADLRSEQPVHFHALRGQRPAVLLFGSFG